METGRQPIPSPEPTEAVQLVRWTARGLAVIPAVVGPAVLFAAVVGAWEAGVWNDLFGLERFTLPRPSDILAAFRDSGSELATNLGDSFQAAVAGYVIGNGLGLLAGVLLVAMPPGLARRLSAAFIAVQALPIIALAPLVALWLGSGLVFKAVVVAVLAFPSMMVYSHRGMTHLDEATHALMASYNTEPLQFFRKVRLPNALPFMFTALKYTTVLALVGVTVAEVMRARSGLGYEITDALQAFETAEAWAAVVIIGGLGVAWYIALGLLERVLVPWASIERDRQ